MSKKKAEQKRFRSSYAVHENGARRVVKNEDGTIERDERKEKNRRLKTKEGKKETKRKKERNEERGKKPMQQRARSFNAKQDTHSRFLFLFLVQPGPCAQGAEEH